MFLTAPKQRRFCLARPSNAFQKVLEQILKVEPVYVKDTGIKVLVTDIDFHEGQTNITGRIKFLDIPTKKVLLKCHQVNIDVRENTPIRSLGSPPSPQPPTYDVAVNAIIFIDRLSVTPYETKAAKILYKNQK